MGRKPGNITSEREIKRRKEIFLEALDRSHGMICTAAINVHIHRNTVLKWRKADPEFDAAVNQINEKAIDFAENALFEKIKQGDTKAIIFYLERKGKSRGYGDVKEVNAELTVIRPRVIFEDSPEAEVLEYLKNPLLPSGEDEDDAD